MRRALGLAVIVSAMSVTVPATAGYTALPAFFAESWAAVEAAPLLRVVPSSGKSARLPVRERPILASVQRGLPLDALVKPEPTPAIVSPSLPAATLEAKEEPPKPVLRPQVMAYASLSEPSIGEDALSAIPFPLERPEDIPVLERKAEPVEAAPADPAPTKLAMLGAPTAGLAIGNLVKMAAADPIGKGACHVEKPFKVMAVGGGDMDLKPDATLNAKMAKQLGLWSQAVEKAAAKHLGQEIETVMVAASYDCRTQNHRRRARLSEHSFGNAIDVSGFKLANGETITIQRDWRGSGQKTAFLKDVHATTCALFQVVLGPGSDGYHENHLHMDLGRWKACR
jgi:hypothetical protein